MIFIDYMHLYINACVFAMKKNKHK